MAEAVDLKAYWEQVKGFSQYPADYRAVGYALGLMAEAGEVCGVVDKQLRGKYDEAEMKRLLVDELGDLCWYAVACLSLDSSEYLSLPFETGERGGGGRSMFGVLLRLVLCASNGYELEVIDIAAHLAGYAGTTLQAVLDANAAKLRGRYTSE